MRNTKKVWLLAIRADLPNSDKDTGDPSRGLKLLAMEKKTRAHHHIIPWVSSETQRKSNW